MAQCDAIGLQILISCVLLCLRYRRKVSCTCIKYWMGCISLLLEECYDTRSAAMRRGTGFAYSSSACGSIVHTNMVSHLTRNIKG